MRYFYFSCSELSCHCLIFIGDASFWYRDDIKLLDFKPLSFFEFCEEIQRLYNIDNPEITCTNGQTITITCPTVGASIYYKLNNANNYRNYSKYSYYAEEEFPDNCRGVSFVVNTPNADTEPPVIIFTVSPSW